MPGLYKLLMYGARDYSHKNAIKRELIKIKARMKPGVELLVIHGGAPGADTLAGIVASELSIHSARVDALWQTRYRGAGPQRNHIMMLMQPDEAVGFHEDIKNSRGTADMKRRLDKAGIKNKIVKR